MRKTQQQKDFIKAAAETDESLMLEAVAGSGKTYTLVAASYGLRGEVLALAFNKRVQEDLSKEMPQHVTCKTLNALGHAAWTNFLGRRPAVEQDKMGTLVSEYLREIDQSGDYDFWIDVLQLAKLGKQCGIVPHGAPGNPKGLTEDADYIWEYLADHHDIDPKPDTIAAAREVLLRSVREALAGNIDFDDQLYMPVVYRAPFKRYDVVIVDEAQDLSGIQHKMLKKSLRKEGRLIAAGDRHQAIYAFRGASASSIDEIVEEFGCKRLPLTVSFRCAEAITRQARRIVTAITSAPNAPHGEVTEWPAWAPADLYENGHAAILCRTNGPLFALAMQCMRNGLGVKMLGRDVGSGLKRIVNKVTNKQNMPAGEFVKELRKWRSRELGKAAERNDKGKEARVRDQHESLIAIIDQAPDTRALLGIIDKLFRQHGTGITLSSIHRSKGFGWETVFFLDPWLVPSKFATSDTQMEQEQNLEYVAITRAKVNLIYINSEDMYEPDQDPAGEPANSGQEPTSAYR